MTIHPLLTMALALAAAAAGAMAQDDRSGFYIVGPFSGFSLGEDAAICEARIQGTGAVYVPGHNPALELSVRQKPSAAAPVVRIYEPWSGRTAACTASTRQTNRT